MILTQMQKEYIHSADKRWNIKTGATRSGKTYLDVLYTLPKRIIERRGQDGIVVLLGNTRGTLARNVLAPMAEIYGAQRVSTIRSDNTATLFGELVYCLGADNKKHVDRLRGSSIKYCYGDEVTTWSEDVFTMLKSRLDKPCSRFDGTCNPEGPNHWFKRFIDSDADIYSQAYTIDDNSFLDAAFVGNLKKEYAGTVYYDRYIRGLWVAAEGIIYRQFADNPRRYTIDTPPPLMFATIGVDFGGNGSAHAFTCTGFTAGYREIITLAEYYRKEIITPTQLENDFVDFVRMCKAKGYKIYTAYCDNAEQTLIQGLRTAALRERLGIDIVNARKGAINDRIRCLCRLMATDRYKICKDCHITADALSTAVWDSKNATKDVRLDDGTNNQDSIDALEYSFETVMRELTEVI